MTTIAGTREIVISNISADFLKDKDLIGSQDPYLVFEVVGGDQVVTKVIKSGGVNPRWTESYVIRTPATGPANLKVTAYNKNTLLADQVIGRGEVPLDEICKDLVRVPLLDRHGRAAGEVRFLLSVREPRTTPLQPVPSARVSAATVDTSPRADGLCESQTFVKVEDRPIVKERKEYILEHHKFEREFTVETKFKGEREIEGPPIEHLGIEERVVKTTEARPPCADAPHVEPTRLTTGYGDRERTSMSSGVNAPDTPPSTRRTTQQQDMSGGNCS